MSNSKKLPDLSEKSVESINSGDSRLAANLNINCSEVRRLMNNSSVSRIVLACAAFLAICAYGKKTPHRSFFHSFLAGGLLMSSVGVFLPILVPYFGIAFVSHLALDFLNHKGEQLLYPYRKRFSLGICSASGLVNRLFLFCGSVLSAGVTLKLLTGVIFHR